ncbi:hypothetical protein [Antarctobacter sp.]|uniref:COG3904 family protein n=1 Tax=Antarctobacter sp. TaxID=1872577 RepID=UPI003A915D7C
MKVIFFPFKSVMVLALSLVSCPASAANIEKGGDSIMGCTATLSGEIAPEDAAKLGTFMALEGWGTDYYSGKDRLCLNSPGGSYLAAVQISGVLNDLGIGTAVAAGDRCESACAIIFMGGKRNGEAGHFWQDRVLNPDGILGFHAPRLTVGEGSYSESDLERAYEIALKSIGSLQRLKLNPHYEFPDSLFIEMLDVPSDSMRYIETVSDAAQWSIEVGPVSFPGGDPDELAKNACLNAQAMNLEYSIDQFEVPSPLFSTSRVNGSEHYFRTVPGFLFEGAYACVVRFELNQFDLPVGKRRLGWFLEFDVNSPEFLEQQHLWPFMLYPPSAALEDLD